MPTIHVTPFIRYRHDESFQPLSCLRFAFNPPDFECTVGMVYHFVSHRACGPLSLCQIAACSVAGFEIRAMGMPAFEKICRDEGKSMRRTSALRISPGLPTLNICRFCMCEVGFTKKAAASCDSPFLHFSILEIRCFRRQPAGRHHMFRHCYTVFPFGLPTDTERPAPSLTSSVSLRVSRGVYGCQKVLRCVRSCRRRGRFRGPRRRRWRSWR